MITSKIGFPDILEPEDQYIVQLANASFSSFAKPTKYSNSAILPRHSLYLTLLGGEFSQESVEVTLEVRTDTGEVIEVLFAHIFTYL